MAKIATALGLSVSLAMGLTGCTDAAPDQQASPSAEVATSSLLVLDDNPAKSAESEYPKLKSLAVQPTARWLYDSSPEVLESLRTTMDAAIQQHKEPTIVIYNIPDRDCGGYSAGGAKDTADYDKWIDSVADIMGEKKAITIIEPDALPSLSDPKCSYQTKKQRFAQITYAATHLNTPTNDVYVDAGNPGYVPAAEMAALLQGVDIKQNADGIALNVSNYYPIDENTKYARAISKSLGYAVHDVIDTSRNGNEDFSGEWCNPPDRLIGHVPTLDTGVAQTDAYLWVNFAGSSDGTCNNGGEAGSWDAKRALGMLKSK